MHFFFDNASAISFYRPHRVVFAVWNSLRILFRVRLWIKIVDTLGFFANLRGKGANLVFNVSLKTFTPTAYRGPLTILSLHSIKFVDDIDLTSFGI